MSQQIRRELNDAYSIEDRIMVVTKIALEILHQNYRSNLQTVNMAAMTRASGNC
jgi:hypothetical protein